MSKTCIVLKWGVFCLHGWEALKRMRALALLVITSRIGTKGYTARRAGSRILAVSKHEMIHDHSSWTALKRGDTDDPRYLSSPTKWLRTLIFRDISVSLSPATLPEPEILSSRWSSARMYSMPPFSAAFFT